MNSNTKIGAVLLGLVLLTTLKHSAFSYLEITPVKFDIAALDWLYSLAVVLVLDAAILYASYRGRIDLARIAAFSVGALSLAAFWNTPGEFGLTQWVAVVVFSAIIPYLQYELAEIFAADLHRADEFELRGRRIAELEADRDKAVARIAGLEAANNEALASNEALARESEAALRQARENYENISQRFSEACDEIEALRAAEQAQIEEVARERSIRIEFETRIESLRSECDALRTDLVAMTGARDQAAKDRDYWQAMYSPFEAYKPLHMALGAGPVVLGRNQILIFERNVTKDGLVLPFRIANNNDPALKKNTGEDLADSE